MYYLSSVSIVTCEYLTSVRRDTVNICLEVYGIVESGPEIIHYSPKHFEIIVLQTCSDWH
jgi:hypothetical protein